MQNAVDAIHGAVHADVQDLVITAAVFPGAGAWFEEMAPVAAEKQRLFSLVQAVGIGKFELRLTLVFDGTNVRITCSGQNFFGIGEVKAAFFHENSADVAGRIPGLESCIFM